MAILLQIQMNIVSAILLIILLGHACFNMNRKNTTNRLFIWIMGLTCFALILEIFSVTLNNPDLKQFIVLHKLIDTIGFIVTPSVPLIGCIFIKEWANRYQSEKIKINKILLLPFLINGIGSLMSYNGNVLFHVTSENIYQRGPLFFIAPCVSYIYCAYSLCLLYHQRNKFTYSELVMFSLFYIGPAVLMIIQLKWVTCLTIWISIAVVIVITYIFILNDQAYRDSLTGLDNRLSYERYAQKIGPKNYNKLFMVYIDIDEFKTINDRYGHYAGDEAIKEFANLLIENFPQRHKKLIRLGGDEFLILLEEQQPEIVAAYMQNLTQHVEAYNNTGGKPYKLKFSYGMACYTSAYESMNQLLECTDQMMYEQKQNRKDAP